MKCRVLIALGVVFYIYGNQEPSEKQLELFELLAHPRVYQKLKKTLSTDYEQVYENTYVANNVMLCEAEEKRLTQKINKLRKELIDDLELSSEECKQFDRMVKKPDVGFVIIDERLEPADTEKKELDDHIKTSILRLAPLLDVHMPIVIELLPEEESYESPGVYLTKKDDTEKVVVCYGHNHFLDSQGIRRKETIEHSMAHELAHIKFKDHYYGWLMCQQNREDPTFQNKRDKYQKIRYFQEVLADVYSATLSLDLAKQCEDHYFSYFWTESDVEALIYNYFKYFSECVRTMYNNHPDKGKLGTDEHPSWPLRYIKAVKIRKLLEAEKKWFTTELADQRYGFSYYENAFVKWVEEVERLKLLKMFDIV